jgi:hypothetical protein
MVISLIFAAEMTIKIISFGLILDENSYLKDPWSILDFIIVSFSMVDIALVNYNLSYIKVIILLLDY